MPVTQDQEEWRPVIGHEGHYEVSNQGRVRSLGRVIMRRYRDGRMIPQTVRGRMLKNLILGTVYKYWMVNLPDEYEASGMRVNLVSKLVLEAFGSPRPHPNAHAKYIDGNALNCALGNIKWSDTSTGVWAERRKEAPRNAPKPETLKARVERYEELLRAHGIEY